MITEAKKKRKKNLPDLPDQETIVIKMVDGDKIRDHPDFIDFTMGGHHYVYPKLVTNEGEIFIDQDMVKEDKVATEGHEFGERLMMKYYGWDYDSAHSIVANAIEAVIRTAIQKGPTKPGDMVEQFKQRLLKELF